MGAGRLWVIGARVERRASMTGGVKLAFVWNLLK